jgi:bacteriorhodopsin
MSTFLASSTETNRSDSAIRLTRGASHWLWAVFAVMALSTLAVAFWSHRRPRGQRVFHQIPIIILTTSTIAYYAMASNLGRSGAAAEFSGNAPGSHPIRDIFWVRYIQWFINAPLILLLILLATGVTLSDIFLTCFMSWVAVICGLVGAFTVTRYKWGFFVFGTLALLYIAWLVLAHARTSTFYGGARLRSSYVSSAGILTALWLIYPIAWACSEGANIIGISGEMIWYGILDLLAGPVFLFFFLHRLRGVDYGSLGLMSGKATDYYGGAYGARAGEKGPGYSGAGAPSVGTGHHDGHHNDLGHGNTATGPTSAVHPGTAPISGSRV